MKLRDVRPIELQDVSRFGLTRHYEGLKENYVYPPIFTSWQLNEAPFPIEWVHSDENGLLGKFSSPEYDYLIKFEPFSYEFDKKQYDCVNASFEVIIDGKPTTQLTSTNHKNQVIGTIQNALSEKLIQYDIDAILFVAIDNISSRMKLYGRMADSFAKNFGTVYRDIRLPNGEAIVILSKFIPSQTQQAIYNFAQEKNQQKPNLR
jgi:hypothetical protein